MANSLQKLQYDKEVYRRSYYQFFLIAFKILQPTDELIDNWHIKYLCDVLQAETERIANKQPKTKDLIINIPPRSLKSKIVTIIWNAWIWAYYPHIKLITSSYGSDLAIEHTVDTRRLIQSDWYQSLYGNMFKLQYDQNTKSKFQNDKGGERRATSVGGPITGEGSDIIICDDPIKVKDANSDLALNTAWDWWSKTMYTRLNDQAIGLRIVIMQRLNEKDLTGMLLKEMADKYTLISIPSELGDNVYPEQLKDHYQDGLFFPRRFSKEILIDTKRSLGTLGYAGQYLQRPAPLEGNLIKSFWFRRFNVTDLPKDIVKNFRTDSAYGKEGSDNSATFCYSVLDGNLYIWSIWNVNLTFPDFVKSYKDFLIQNNIDQRSRCYFEPKASGLSIIQQMKLERLPNGQSLNVIEGRSPKESKVTRITAASSTIEGGHVFLLANQSWIESLLAECIMFPNGANDDQVDVLSAIITEEMSSTIGFA